MSIGKELAKEAKKNGICEEWYQDLRTSDDKDKLLGLYIKGIDFCLSNDYPTNEYIRNNFKGRMEAYGIHLDEELSCTNERTVVALGVCSGDIENSGFTVSEVFLKHSSILTLVARDNSFTMIDMFDNSGLSIVAHDNAKVVINHYGGEIVFEKHENAQIKIREKHKKTY